jgi:aminomethyltransferase
MNLQHTPLYNQHISLKAKMVPFGGWEMPVQYQGIIKEYQAAREQVAIEEWFERVRHPLPRTDKIPMR